jgi:hypothetical protein
MSHTPRIGDRILAEQTCLDCGHLHPHPMLVDRLAPATLVRAAGHLIHLLSECIDSIDEDGRALIGEERALAMCAGVQAVLQLVEATHTLHACQHCGVASWLPRAVNAYVCVCDHEVGAGKPARNLRRQYPRFNSQPMPPEPHDPPVYEYVPLLELAPGTQH